MKRILVIAYDPDLRSSLQFALEAEGYLVTSSPSTATRERPKDFACTVVDHHAMSTDPATAIAFCRAFDPVILLANAATHALSPYAFRTVMKPLLGPALTGAIREAIEARAVAK